MPFYAETYIDRAYRWLCRQRKDYHFNNDVWHLRFHWTAEKEKLLTALQRGTFRFCPVQKIRGRERTCFLWSARDALVLKAMALYLAEQLRPVLSDRIFHLAGAGGGNSGSKAAVREVYKALPDAQFVLRTDVKGYYASISHRILMEQLRQCIDEPFLLWLLRSFLRHSINDEGHYYNMKKGIALGCPLSPLLGALFLKPLDDAMEKTGLFYIRFMDDWIVLSPTRWKLRRAIAAVNRTLEALQLEKHPDKTSIGRTTAGFDFLGYRFCVETATQPQEHLGASSGMGTRLPARQAGGLRATETAPGGGPPLKERNKRPQGKNLRPRVRLQPAVKTLQNFYERCSRLYEQGTDEGRIGNYITYWRRWLTAGLDGFLEGNGTSATFAPAMGWARITLRAMTGVLEMARITLPYIRAIVVDWVRAGRSHQRVL